MKAFIVEKIEDKKFISGVKEVKIPTIEEEEIF